MNFFEHQAAARRQSARLLLLFGLAVACIVLAVNLGVMVLSGVTMIGVGMDDFAEASVPQLLFGLNRDRVLLLLLCSLVTVGLIAGGSLYRIASLRGGGESVAQKMGGTPVAENTADFSLRRLRNVVEEMAIASGVPVPRIFVLEHEAAINAFAAGYSPADAAVAVTRGALDRLNRDELQGVIAHEFSHVLNGDMRLNIRLMGVLHGILLLSLAGERLIHDRPGTMGLGREQRVSALFGMALLASGAVGLFFARLIKAGISRSREDLADASAVQFTRQTSGLAGALKKMAGMQEGARLGSRADAEEISHMLFGDGIGFSGWFATHPPLLERIRKLDPTLAGSELERLRMQWLKQPPVGLEEDLAMGLHQDGEAMPTLQPPPLRAAVPPPMLGTSGAGPVVPPSLPGSGSLFAITPPMVVAQVAHPNQDDYHRADAITRVMPPALQQMARDREWVMPLLIGLLLSDADPVLANQRSEIVYRMGEGVADTAQALRREHLAGLHPMLRLPLASLAFPALRHRPRPQLDTFLDTVFAMVNTDRDVSLFEYCLGRLLQVHVREALQPARHVRFGRRKLDQVRQHIATLLAVVAQHGHGDAMAAQRAYLAGLQRVLPRDHLSFAAPADGVQALDAVWEPLDLLEPAGKELLVEALTAAISHDNRVSVAEAELLRTICAALHCPLPPMLEKA